MAKETLQGKTEGLTFHLEGGLQGGVEESNSGGETLIDQFRRITLTLTATGMPFYEAVGQLLRNFPDDEKLIRADPMFRNGLAALELKNRKGQSMEPFRDESCPTCKPAKWAIFGNANRSNHLRSPGHVAWLHNADLEDVKRIRDGQNPLGESWTSS